MNWNWRSCNLPPPWSLSAAAAWGFPFCKCKGGQAPGAAPALCAVLGSQAHLRDFTWELEVILLISSSTLTVTEGWRTTHWVQEEKAISSLSFPEDLVPISQLLENLDQVSVAAAQQVLCCLPGKEEMWPPVALYASFGSSVIMVFTLFMVKIMQFYSDGKSGWQQLAEQPVALRCACVCEQWATGSPLGAQDLGSSRESNRGCWHMDNPKCVFSPGKMWKPLWYHNGRGERVKLMKLPHHHVSEEGKQWWRTWGQGSKFQVFTC